MKFTLSSLIVFLLAACASTSQVMKLGPDTYQVDGETHVMSDGSGSMAKNNAIAAANIYCSELGKEILVKNIASEIVHPYHHTTITFSCLDKDDPGLVRPTYEKEADIIIKNK